MTAWGGAFPEEAPGGEKGGAGSHGAAGRDSKGCLWTLPGESCAVPCHAALERCPRHRAPGQQGAGRAAPPVPPRLPSWLQPGRAAPTARAWPSPWRPCGGRAVCPCRDAGAGGVWGLRPAPVGLSRAPCCVAQGERDTGKGLEMRKLVLSGFLASEEIYINQLEALLLVSTAGGRSPRTGGWGPFCRGSPRPPPPPACPAQKYFQPRFLPRTRRPSRSGRCCTTRGSLLMQTGKSQG